MSKASAIPRIIRSPQITTSPTTFPGLVSFFSLPKLTTATGLFFVWGSVKNHSFGNFGNEIFYWFLQPLGAKQHEFDTAKTSELTDQSFVSIEVRDLFCEGLVKMIFLIEWNEHFYLTNSFWLFFVHRFQAVFRWKKAKVLLLKLNLPSVRLILTSWDFPFVSWLKSSWAS